MLARPESRLAVTVLLLSILTIPFLIELARHCLPPRKKQSDGPSGRATAHLVSPLFVSFFQVIFVLIVFVGNQGARPATANIAAGGGECELNVDADIGGDGIRLAIWAQELVLLLITVIGILHTQATGVKEIGAGLTITHVSFVIALLVQKVRGSLSAPDAIIGSLILDSQNSAIPIQLANKQTLAARWQACIIVGCQVLGLVVLAVIVQGFSRGEFSRQDCQCLTVFWWGWLSDCSAVPPAEMAVFWTYYACRCVASVQCGYNTLANAWKFDEGERDGVPLNDITFPPMRANRRELGHRRHHSPSLTESSYDLEHRSIPYRDEADPRHSDVDVSSQAPPPPPPPPPSPPPPAGPTTDDEITEVSHTRAPTDGIKDKEAPDLQNIPAPQSSNTARDERLVIHRRPTTGTGSSTDSSSYFSPEVNRLSKYDAYPSTVTLLYITYGVFAVTSMATAEITMRDNELQPSSQVFSVGQIIAIVVAVVTIVRGIWLFRRMFVGKDGKFISPFTFSALHDMRSLVVLVLSVWVAFWAFEETAALLGKGVSILIVVMKSTVWAMLIRESIEGGMVGRGAMGSVLKGV